MSALEIGAPEDVQCHEFVIPALRVETHPIFGAQPRDGVQRSPDGAAVLHMGPGRWLVVGSPMEREWAHQGVAEAAGGSLVDVSGKWMRLRVTGAQAPLYLSQFLNVAQVLCDRDCAPVNILGCPILLVRCESGFELWTTRSWAAWLHESLIVRR